ncbi:MAG: transglycosylase SLT domain-containing protein [Leptospirales bacterium]|nr:transglycosylase SLT domain-containing protein [Leptospirales bacterium]
MKLSFIFKTLFLISVLVFINSNLYAWTLVDILTGEETADSGFNPEKDILFLPELGQKGLFESIDDLSIMRKKDVRKYLNLYLSRGRNFTVRAIERSAIYKEEIDAIFAENPDIPADIAYLPLLESCFNPQAVSRSKAVGLWQFMANTAAPLGLKNTKWVDERRHVEKSTRAAIRHLRGLYRTFGSWDIALAAYNGGAGYMRRSLEGAGTWDFWELLANNVLNVETSEYVPRFTALLLIYKNQKFFGISGGIKKTKPVKTGTVIVKHNVSIDAVGRVSGVSAATIRSLNPELSTGAIPPGGYNLILPAGNAQRLENNMASLSEYVAPKAKPAPKNVSAKKGKNSGKQMKIAAKSAPQKKVAVKQYKVKKGDTISSIAKKNNKTASEIMQVNKIANIDKIIPGKVILIPN